MTIEIDGSILEGGGQILRMSVAFSAIMGVPVRVFNIRVGRSKPGLAPQHLKGIQLVAQMCHAKTNGLEISSTNIKFSPGILQGGTYLADTQTAGSVSLLLQVALPCALLANDQVILNLKGGTNAEMAPQIDYMTEVFRPTLEKFGCSFDLDLHRRGYYPKGGGHVTVTINPVAGFKSVILTDFGVVKKIYGWSFVAGTLPNKLSYQMADGAKEILGSISRSINIDCYKETPDIAPNNCNGIVLVCETSTGCILGGSGLGKRGVDPISVGRSAGQELLNVISGGSCTDTFTQDQIIIFMSLAEGKSSIKVNEVTLHTQTAIYIAELFTKCKFNIQPSENNCNIIECTGIGFKNKNIMR